MRVRPIRSVVGLYPAGELLCQLDVTPHMVSQSFDTVVADHEP